MQIDVFPPHGFVRFVDWHGPELSIVNAARVSFHKESQEFGSDDLGLLRFLLTHKHGTPFEQGFQSSWHIRLPLFVMREWVRHRIGHSVNEESGRYVELRPDFYIPERIRSQVGRPGAYTFEPIKDLSVKVDAQNMIDDHAKWSFALYQELLAQGIAKEQARIVLPLNLYTEIRWTANARSLMHFLALRNAEDAMYEIAEYAKALERIFEIHMPNIHKIFVANGRIAP